jgi:hypothetical protein
MLASFVGFNGLNSQCSYIGDCRLSLANVVVFCLSKRWMYLHECVFQ